MTLSRERLQEMREFTEHGMFVPTGNIQRDLLTLIDSALSEIDSPKCDCSDPPRELRADIAHAGWCALMRANAAKLQAPKCQTCDDTGMVPASIETATGSAACPYIGEPCPDCQPPASTDSPKCGTAPPDIAHLLKFYNVTTVEEVARIQSQRIDRLIAKLPPQPDPQPRNYREG
jgi:hypothetical protein